MQTLWIRNFTSMHQAVSFLGGHCLGVLPSPGLKCSALWQVLTDSESAGMHRHERYYYIAICYANFVKGLSKFHYKPYFQGAHKSTMKCILCSHFYRLNKSQWHDFDNLKQKKKKKRERGFIKILFINFSNITWKFKDTIKALLNRALQIFQHLQTLSFTYSIILLLSGNLIKLMKT